MVKPRGFFTWCGWYLFFAVSSFATVTFDRGAAGVNGFSTVDKITWTDSRGNPREVYFAKDLPGNNAAKGYITRYVYKTASGTQVIANEHNSSDRISGLCITVDHNNVYDGQNYGWSIQKGQGHNYQQDAIVMTDNHLIYRVKFSQWGNSGRESYDITVDYTFFSGVDYFIYAITYDTRGQQFQDDARSPYSQFNWDGEGHCWEPISGMRYGDNKKFAADNMNQTDPKQSSWTYGGSNLIPYVWEWITSRDREIGKVQTQTFTQRPTTTSTIGSSGTLAGIGVWNLAFQMNGYQEWLGKRIAWGNPYGSLGSDGGFLSVSVAVLLNEHSVGGVAALIEETEKIHTGGISFSSSGTGSVVTSGPKGSGNPTSTTYSPAGFNHVYRTWEYNADGNNNAAFNFDIASGSYKSPVFVIHNWTSTDAPTSITRNGNALNENTDYYASVDETNQRLFLTLRGNLSASNEIVIGGGAGSGLSVSSFTVSPTSIVNESATDITLNLTASDADGSITSVTADLSDLGGQSSVPLSGSEPNFTLSYTVPAGTSTGSKSIVVTITDNDGNTRKATAVVTVVAPETVLWIYNDANTYGAAQGWATEPTAITEQTSGGYEGTKYFRINYTIADGWGGCGIAFDNWNTAINLSTYETIRFAYRGLTSGHTASVSFGYGNEVSVNITTLQPAAEWKKVEVPLDNTGRRNDLYSINIIFGGAASGSGSLDIDGIQAVTRFGTVVNIRPMQTFVPRHMTAVQLLGRTYALSAAEEGRISICDLSGRHIASFDMIGKQILWKAPRSGIYLIRFTGVSGSDLARILVK